MHRVYKKLGDIYRTSFLRNSSDGSVRRVWKCCFNTQSGKPCRYVDFSSSHMRQHVKNNHYNDDPQTKNNHSNDDPQTKNNHSNDDPQTKNNHSNDDPQTKNNHSNDDPLTLPENDVVSEKTLPGNVVVSEKTLPENVDVVKKCMRSRPDVLKPEKVSRRKIIIGEISDQKWKYQDMYAPNSPCRDVPASGGIEEDFFYDESGMSQASTTDTTPNKNDSSLGLHPFVLESALDQIGVNSFVQSLFAE